MLSVVSESGIDNGLPLSGLFRGTTLLAHSVTKTTRTVNTVPQVQCFPSNYN